MSIGVPSPQEKKKQITEHWVGEQHKWVVSQIEDFNKSKSLPWSSGPRGDADYLKALYNIFDTAGYAVKLVDYDNANWRKTVQVDFKDDNNN